METMRNEARRRGIRMAAQVAAIGGLIAASAGLVRAEGARSMPTGAQQANAATDGIASVTDAIRLQAASKSCGCGACWGPPAPPPLSAELAARLAEAA